MAQGLLPYSLCSNYIETSVWKTVNRIASFFWCVRATRRSESPSSSLQVFFSEFYLKLPSRGFYYYLTPQSPLLFSQLHTLYEKSVCILECSLPANEVGEWSIGIRLLSTNQVSTRIFQDLTVGSNWVISYSWLLYPSFYLTVQTIT